MKPNGFRTLMQWTSWGLRCLVYGDAKDRMRPLHYFCISG